MPCMDIEDCIVRSVENCRTKMYPRNGDCGNVAVALNRYFRDSTIVGLISPEQNETVLHFAVRIDGVVYDGFGRTNPSKLCEVFIDGEVDNPESHIRNVENVKQYGYIVFPDLVSRITKSLEESYGEV